MIPKAKRCIYCGQYFGAHHPKCVARKTDLRLEAPAKVFIPKKVNKGIHLWR